MRSGADHDAPTSRPGGGGLAAIADSAPALARRLPEVAATRVAVHVTADAQRQIRGGHPWVFASSITSSGDGAPGDLAVVFDRNRRFLAIGLWDPSSALRVRVLHRGRPTTIDAAWFDDAIGASIDRRASLLERGDTDACRLVHGENDGLPGLVVDRYADHVVLELFSAAWFTHLGTVLDSVIARCRPAVVVLRLARIVAAGETHGLADGDVLWTRQPGRSVTGAVEFIENGLRFGADVRRGQKTGHFLDQRDNRARVRAMARGRTVLDVFSCTGGFSVHAAAGGATHVWSIDQSAPALAEAEANMARNRELAAVRAATHRTVCGDAFEMLADLTGQRRRFDVVVIDPPSFTRRSSQVEAALRAYRRLADLGVELTAPGGTLVQASCSARVRADDLEAAVDGALARHGRRAVERSTTGHAIDHPIGFAEGSYLAAVYSTLD